MQEFVNVALIQTRATPDPTASLRHAFDLVDRALEEPPDLMLLPEGFAAIVPSTQEPPLAIVAGQVEKCPAIAPFVAASRQHSTLFLLGGVPERTDDGRTYNSIVAVRGGQAEVIYRKIHLFDVITPDGVHYRESARIAPGEAASVLATDFATIGLSVCYDLRFPELYRALVAAGSEVLVVPAAFTQATGRLHWEPLLRARAIENQCYVLAAAQCGEHYPGRLTWGHSMVVDPLGQVTALADEPDILRYQLKGQAVQQTRENMPCWGHRKLGAMASARVLDRRQAFATDQLAASKL